MNTVSEEEKELPDEDKRVEDGILYEGQNASADVELKVESVIKDVNDAGRRALQAQGAVQVQQQQSQSGTICWERFLHVTSIKVLLVESDDSTRHIVTALLRNCNYEVIEAASGLQAWRVLEDLTNHIDLVLTELEMPCVSGIGLLCKIMSHNTRKNIPVIMMSSRDSMGLVFKCLSKGAVDFLVKPIRKNELKNLWQHVWRRCHSSSGSGSESGTQTQNSVRSKSVEKCDNNSGSNDGEGNGSDGLNIGDGSDDGSGTQSSWTKQAVEVDSSQSVSPWDQVTECPDSTCAQVIRSNAENSGNKKVHVAATKNCQEEKQPDNTKCKYPVTSLPQKLETQHENPIDSPINLVGEKHKNVVEIDPSASNKRIEKEQIVRKEFEAQKMVAALSEIKNNAIHEPGNVVTEPSLKRLREMKESRETSQDDRYVFRCSEQSAFTRYNTSSKSNPLRTPNGLTGNSLVVDSGLESANNVVSNNIDMGSTTNKLATKLLTVQDKSEATCTTNGLHPSSAYKPVKNDFRNCQSILIKTSDMQATTLLAPSSSHADIPDQHLHHHNNHYPHNNSHHFHNQEQQPTSNHDKFSLKQLAANALNSESSNVMVGPFEGKLGNHSLNKSASGSNHGSNGQNGSSTGVNVGGNNGKTETGLDGKNGSGDASGSGSGSRMDPNKLAQREAALTKFRQKKKRRCFKNKVRYQNRKRLAEQRPRNRGQFVRQMGRNSPSSNENE